MFTKKEFFMKFSKNMMIVYVLIGAQGACLFGKAERAVPSKSAVKSVSQPVSEKPVDKKAQTSTLTPSLASAVTILNSYSQKRSDFIKEFEMARKAFQVVNAQAGSSRDMKVIATKFKPILESDELAVKSLISITPAL